MNRGSDAGHPPNEPAERGLRDQKGSETAGPRGPRDPSLIRRGLTHTPLTLRARIAATGITGKTVGWPTSLPSSRDNRDPTLEVQPGQGRVT